MTQNNNQNVLYTQTLIFMVMQYSNLFKQTSSNG